jgi:hypothetical protein
MTARKLLVPILRAGAKLRDAAIEATGEPVKIKKPALTVRDTFGVKQTQQYQSAFATKIIPLWDDYRMNLTFGYMSEERSVQLQAHAKMGDDIPEESVIEILTEHPLPDEIQTSTYRVTKNQVLVSSTQYARMLWLVPYRGDLG